jgi:transposase-like protein
MPGTEKKERRSFTEEFKARAIDLSQQIGIVKTAEQLGIARSVIQRWRGKVGVTGNAVPGGKPSRYTPEVKAQAVALAKQIGPRQAGAKLGISRSAISDWISGRRGGNVPTALHGTDKFPIDFQQKAIALAAKVGVQEAARQLHINNTNLYKWARLARGLPARRADEASKNGTVLAALPTKPIGKTTRARPLVAVSFACPHCGGLITPPNHAG